MRLDRLDHLPEALLDIGPRDVRRVFPNPTLIRLGGRRAEPLFLSTLLHGDETTSFFVLQNIMRRMKAQGLPRALMIFVGNVDAAEAGVRRLPGQADFNRVWAGGAAPQAELAREVLDAARAIGPFASIDIHNTSGTNPLYGCVNQLDPEHVGLAALFSRILVHYDNPATTQSIAFSKFCPATTIECGQPGNQAGVTRATDFVFDVLHAQELPRTAPHGGDVDIYRTVGRIEVDPGASFAFAAADTGAAADTDIVFPVELDHLNFTDLDVGAPIARIREPEIGRASCRERV